MLDFQVDEPGASTGLRLVEDPERPYRIDGMNGERVLAPPENHDYFQRGGISFRVEDPLPGDTGLAFLIIDHLDADIGLIQVTYDADRPHDPAQPGSDPAHTLAGEGAGITCLGTGQPRRAIFKLDRPAYRHRQDGGADIQIAGVRSLRGVSLTPDLDEAEWEKVRQQIPSSVGPKLTLSRPIQLVVTVGADARTLEGQPDALDQMRELCPLARALGFSGIESYVKWNFVETERDRFDWRFYDALVAEARRHGLKWFPLLIVGSAYTLPDWYYQSEENEGFVCLEHGKRNDIQTIFCENQTPHVQRFLREFGAHYEPTGHLLGVRLGPSGNYGESQYPATGEWGRGWSRHHIHIGWWAGDGHASPHFRRFLEAKYGDISELNRAWDAEFQGFDEIETFIPQQANTRRQRKDIVDWYVGAMTDWCERWAVWAREAMPGTDIYQSAGGWGFVESGTDFTEQTKSMVKVKGGIRITNEDDSYVYNFYATRMVSSAARFYGVPLGSEPAGFGSARSVAGRIFNVLVNNGQHLFFYGPNLIANDQAVDKWLELAPLLDRRGEPFIEVAALYPDTQAKLDDGVMRHLWAFSFYQRVVALRPHLDFDFCSERMILDGALPRWKVLVLLWSSPIEAEVLDQIDRWVQEGGRVIYPVWDSMPVGTVEGDFSVYNRWLRGETGEGRGIPYRSDEEPPQRYAEFIKLALLEMDDLDARTQRMLRIEKQGEVYASVLVDGTMAILNYTDDPAEIVVPSMGEMTVKPYSIELLSENL